MNEPPYISALLPVWTGVEYLDENINSIQAQTFTNWELLIIGEPDGIPRIKQIAQSHALRDGRIRWIENEAHLGLAASLNKGIELARGKYIARIDADDPSHPTRFEKQARYLDQHPEVGILGTQFRVISPNRVEIFDYPTNPENIRACLLSRVCICHPTVMLRRELFITNDIRYPNEVSEDYALWLRLLDKAIFANLDEVLVDRHMGFGTNASALKGNNLIENAQRLNMMAVQDYFHIDTTKFALNRFLLCAYEYSVCEHVQISEFVEWMADSLYLLLVMELANLEYRVFHDAALARTLKIKWNWIVDGSLISKIPNITHSPPHLPEKSDNPFSVDLIASLQTIEPRLPLNAPINDILSIVRTSAMIFVNHAINFFTTVPACVLFGIGADYKDFMREHSDTSHLFKIAAFCDNDATKQGQNKNGRPVVSPIDLPNWDFDYILVATRTFFSDIYSQLIGIGIPPEKIFPLDLFRYKVQP